MEKQAKPTVLILCTGNSCRSQMAEGWTRHLKTDQIDAYSAGTKAQGLNPLAVKVMAEAGIDISRHSSKALDQLEEDAAGPASRSWRQAIGDDEQTHHHRLATSEGGRLRAC